MTTNQSIRKIRAIVVDLSEIGSQNEEKKCITSEQIHELHLLEQIGSHKL